MPDKPYSILDEITEVVERKQVRADLNASHPTRWAMRMLDPDTGASTFHYIGDRDAACYARLIGRFWVVRVAPESAAND